MPITMSHISSSANNELEWNWEDEYDPMWPNDYETVVQGSIWTEKLESLLKLMEISASEMKDKKNRDNDVERVGKWKSREPREEKRNNKYLILY
jgi:hypothetical protein